MMPALSPDTPPGLLPRILEHVFSFAEFGCFARQADLATWSTIQELALTSGLGTQLCDRSHENKSNFLELTGSLASRHFSLNLLFVKVHRC